MRSLPLMLAALAVSALIAGGGLAMAQLDDPQAAPQPASAPRAADAEPAPVPPDPTVPAPATAPQAPSTSVPSRRASRSRALGLPFRGGRLLGGVPLPADGPDHFTWDLVHHVRPNPAWRRHATDRTVARVLRAIARFRAANPDAPRVGVADLSRPRGGPFGSRYGGLGHASHQNGLDADVLYPRDDRLLREPARPSQVDRRLAQRLVDEFVRAGATKVFVGPSLGLRGPPSIVMPLVHHDDHLHVRFNP